MQTVPSVPYLIECLKNSPRKKFLPKSIFYNAVKVLSDLKRHEMLDDTINELEARKDIYREKVDAEWREFINKVNA